MMYKDQRGRGEDEVTEVCADRQYCKDEVDGGDRKSVV